MTSAKARTKRAESHGDAPGVSDVGNEANDAPGAATRSLTVVLDLPDHRLTINRIRTNPRFRQAMVDRHKEAAQLIGYATIATADRPFYPAEPVFAVCRVERKKRGQRWDYGGMVEALKPAFDGLQGLAYTNDSQVAGSVILWDEQPTGTGLVQVTFVPLEQVRWEAQP